ncbi:hypothetical protein [Paenibacillus doosanensis]|uniref:hypothetical protein n=1 Tax=Paenibacillus doosanensis TaxID=1229154 RepID=UPI00217F2779|nr:hypothetical protein [Paenibacillus doosanensis]
MWIPVEIIKERENPVIMDGIKSLLKESYHISENEANLIMNRASERSEGLIFDYFPYVHSIHELSDGIRNTLDKHLNRVDQEGIMVFFSDQNVSQLPGSRLPVRHRRGRQGQLGCSILYFKQTTK